MGLKGRIRYENLSAVTTRADGAVDYGAPPVRLGDTVVPARVAYVIEGADRSPSLRIEFAIRDGRPVCERVHVEASPDGRGVRAGDLNALPSLDRLAEASFLEFAIEVPDEPFGWFIGQDRKRRRAAAQDIHTRGDAELVEVARIYRENVDSNPRAAVADLLGYSERTASRRIEQARAKGLLPPTTQGKKKA